MKQIRLKDGVKIVDNCWSCPCMERDDFYGDPKYCNLDGAISYDNSEIPKDCPLEDYKRKTNEPHAIK